MSTVAEAPAPPEPAVKPPEVVPVVETSEVKKGPKETAEAVVKPVRDRLPLRRALRLVLPVAAMFMATACGSEYVGTKNVTVTASADVPVLTEKAQEDIDKGKEAVAQAVSSAITQGREQAPVIAAGAQTKAAEVAASVAQTAQDNRPAAEAAAAQAGAAVSQGAETVAQAAPVVAENVANAAVSGVQTTAEAASDLAQAAAPVAAKGAGFLERFFGGAKDKLGGEQPGTSAPQVSTSEKPVDPRLAQPQAPVITIK